MDPQGNKQVNSSGQGFGRYLTVNTNINPSTFKIRSFKDDSEANPDEENNFPIVTHSPNKLVLLKSLSSQKKTESSGSYGQEAARDSLSNITQTHHSNSLPITDQASNFGIRISNSAKSPIQIGTIEEVQSEHSSPAVANKFTFMLNGSRRESAKKSSINSRPLSKEDS